MLYALQQGGSWTFDCRSESVKRKYAGGRGRTGSLTIVRRCSPSHGTAYGMRGAVRAVEASHVSMHRPTLGEISHSKGAARRRRAAQRARGPATARNGPPRGARWRTSLPERRNDPTPQNHRNGCIHASSMCYTIFVDTVQVCELKIRSVAQYPHPVLTPSQLGEDIHGSAIVVGAASRTVHTANSLRPITSNTPLLKERGYTCHHSEGIIKYCLLMCCRALH